MFTINRVLTKRTLHPPKLFITICLFVKVCRQDIPQSTLLWCLQNKTSHAGIQVQRLQVSSVNYQTKKAVLTHSLAHSLTQVQVSQGLCQASSNVMWSQQRAHQILQAPCATKLICPVPWEHDTSSAAKPSSETTATRTDERKDYSKCVIQHSELPSNSTCRALTAKTGCSRACRRRGWTVHDTEPHQRAFQQWAI